MPAFVDRTGEQVFAGTITRQAPHQEGQHTRWFFTCKRCGKESPRPADWANLRTGSTKSCGCLRREVSSSKLQDLTGRTFGHRYVERQAPNSKRGHTRWHVVCTYLRNDGSPCGRKDIVEGCTLHAESSCGRHRPGQGFASHPPRYKTRHFQEGEWWLLPARAEKVWGVSRGTATKWAEEDGIRKLAVDVGNNKTTDYWSEIDVAKSRQKRTRTRKPVVDNYTPLADLGDELGKSFSALHWHLTNWKIRPKKVEGRNKLGQKVYRSYISNAIANRLRAYYSKCDGELLLPGPSTAPSAEQRTEAERSNGRPLQQAEDEPSYRQRVAGFEPAALEQLRQAIHGVSRAAPCTGDCNGVPPRADDFERARPAKAKHLHWQDLKEAGWSYMRIAIKHKDDTGEDVTEDAVKKALKRLKKRGDNKGGH